MSKSSPPPLGENRFLSNGLSQLWLHWLTTVLLWGLSVPLAIGIWRSEEARPMLILPAIFFIAGVFALGDVLKRSRTWLCAGRMPLTLNPFPGSIGGDVGGYILCRLPAWQLLNTPIHLTLSCFHVYQHGKAGQRREICAKRWSRECMAEVVDRGGDCLLMFRFELPQNLPSTSEKSDDYYYWQLELSGDLDHYNIDRSYKIPVYETRQCSDESLWHLDWREHSRAEQFKEQAVENALNIQQTSGALQIHSPAFKQLRFKLIIAACGAALAFICGYFFLFHPFAFLIGESLALFALLGALLTAASLIQIFRALHAQIDIHPQGQIRICHKVFGMPFWLRRIDRNNVQHLELHKTGSAGAGAKLREYFDIQLVHQTGRVLLATNLEGADNSRHALESIGLLSGLDITHSEKTRNKNSGR